ncbi:MAG TPA: 50S ribosomal protein L6 [Burkholderiales bacterium]|nr:50S ribosomal protein L6 [Burkholderiales bacterium]
MSRVAKNPVLLPAGVEVNIDLGGKVVVRGGLGTLSHSFGDEVIVHLEDRKVVFSAANNSQHAGAMSGTARALVANMVRGVNNGFEKKLTLVGVGYKAQVQGDLLNLTLGFSHPIAYKLPAGVKAETPTQTEIILRGIDKQKVGQVAAEVRAYRKPEPYKGKGVRYSDEVVLLKETKKK